MWAERETQLLSKEFSQCKRDYTDVSISQEVSHKTNKRFVNINMCYHMCMLTFHSIRLTWCTTSFKNRNFVFCPHGAFVCFVWISEQTAIISLYNINWLDFINQMKSVYSAVRNGSLNKAVCASYLKG